MIAYPGISESNKYRNPYGLPGRLPTEIVIRTIHVTCPNIRETGFPLVVPDVHGVYSPIVFGQGSRREFGP